MKEQYIKTFGINILCIKEKLIIEIIEKLKKMKKGVDKDEEW